MVAVGEWMVEKQEWKKRDKLKVSCFRNGSDLDQAFSWRSREN